MHVLMLGWEFPPFIAGGLGTACHGLTKALDKRGTDVTFVLPKAIDRSESLHVSLISPPAAGKAGAAVISRPSPQREGGAARTPREEVFVPGQGMAAAHAARAGAGPGAPSAAEETFAHVRFIGVPAGFSNPYQRAAVGADEGLAGRWVIRRGKRLKLAEDELPQEADVLEGEPYSALQRSPAGQPWHIPIVPAASGDDYTGDLMQQVERFANFCVAATRHLRFDVIHAHDWMTFPAGTFIARLTGKPLVVQVHSTEFDRSGAHVNQRVYDIERRGMHSAMRVIAVSQLTKNVIMRRYGVPGARVEVVYNGVDLDPTQGHQHIGIQSKDKIVLYFGRITYQKGPEYFIRAANRVLEMMPDVKFVVAGSGDQAKGMIELAAHLGIGHKVLFTGFLRGKDIQRVFAMADLYVMPSVSEPFGIAPLEAMAHEVPVLISKSSGVSEVLTHALKVDFWDIDDMANKIIAVLRHPPLSKTLTEHGSFEVRRITWDGAASRCEQVYGAVIDEMRGTAAPARV